MAWGQKQEGQQKTRPPEDVDLGVCPRCRKNPITDSQTLCSECTQEEDAEARAGQEDARTASSAKAEERREQQQKQRPSSGKTAHPDQAKPPAKDEAQKPAPPAKEAPKAPPTQPLGGRQLPPRAAAAAAPAALGISTGRKDKRPRLFIYGPGSVGKTSMMCEAANIIVIPCEVGAEGFDVPRFDELDYGDAKKGPPRTLGELRQCLRWLLTQPHDYEYLGIDGAGALEALIFREVVSDYNKSPMKKGDATTLNEVGGGYKTGQENAVDKWRLLLADLDRLREQRGMGIIITGHAMMRKFDDPMGVAFDRYQIKLDERGAGVVFEWADLVLFANFIDKAKKVGRRFKGIGGTQRMLYSERTASYDAKQRAPYVLPPQLAMPEGYAFATLQHQLEMRKHPDLIRKSIDELLEHLVGVKVAIKGGGEALIVDLALTELERNPSPERLLHLKNRLDLRVEQAEEEREAAADGQQTPTEGQDG